MLIIVSADTGNFMHTAVCTAGFTVMGAVLAYCGLEKLLPKYTARRPPPIDVSVNPAAVQCQEIRDEHAT
ncbi:MAG TPA: hypothetical protein VMV25_05995 [Steroidobacteraceae bacterium]|nr:hypothetical protein [Steroidobacteraceae bacterium]